MILFISLPFIGFLLGMNYQQTIDTLAQQSTMTYLATPSKMLTRALDPTVNWKTYTDSNFGYSFKYPADYKPYLKNGNAFYSSDAQFDKITTAKTKGIEIGSTVYGPGEDTQKYIGQSTKMNSILASKLTLPQGFIAKVYVNTEDIAVTIDYKKDNKSIRLMIWCGGENGNPTSCENVLTLLLPTFKFTN